MFFHIFNYFSGLLYPLLLVVLIMYNVCPYFQLFFWSTLSSAGKQSNQSELIWFQKLKSKLMLVNMKWIRVLEPSQNSDYHIFMK